MLPEPPRHIQIPACGSPANPLFCAAKLGLPLAWMGDGPYAMCIFVQRAMCDLLTLSRV